MDQAKLLEAISKGIQDGFTYTPGEPLNMKEQKGGLSALVFFGHVPHKWNELSKQQLPDETVQSVINHQIDILFSVQSIEKTSTFFLLTERELSIEEIQERLREKILF